MKTITEFEEWLEVAYDIADEELQRIALPVGTYTAKSIFTIQSKQRVCYKGANYENKVRKYDPKETEREDSLCVLSSSSGATYSFDRAAIFKVIKELEPKAGIQRKAIRTWKVEDQRNPKLQFFIKLPCKKIMKGFAKMAKKSILVYNLTEGTISGEDDLGYQLSIPVVQESEQPLPDIKFNLSGLDLEHLDGDTTVMLYYDEDERGDYKDIQLTMISDDNWLVGLDTSHTDRKGWRRAFQYYPKSYEDDRDYNYHQIQESTSQELEEETKSQDTLSAKTESSSIENSEEQSPSQTANHNDEELLSQDCPSTQSINPSNNRQESTLANAKAVSGTQLDTNTHSNIDQDALEYIMSTGEDTSYLEGFYDPATETRALASSYPTSENKKDDSSPSAINQLAMEIELESESSSNTDSSTGALDKLMDDISREAELCSPINDRCDDSSTRALQKLMDDISREAQPCSPTENASNGPLSDLPDDLIEALT